MQSFGADGSRRFRRRMPLVFLAALVGALFVAGGASAQSPTIQGITFCVNKNNGDTRIIKVWDSSYIRHFGSSCSSTETAIVWESPTGPTGPTGPSGSSGPSGPERPDR